MVAGHRILAMLQTLDDADTKFTLDSPSLIYLLKIKQGLLHSCDARLKKAITVTYCLYCYPLRTPKIHLTTFLIALPFFAPTIASFSLKVGFFSPRSSTPFALDQLPDQNIKLKGFPTCNVFLFSTSSVKVIYCRRNLFRFLSFGLTLILKKLNNSFSYFRRSIFLCVCKTCLCFIMSVYSSIS